jgi:GNAT superfamily N-acetyltransferase
MSFHLKRLTQLHVRSARDMFEECFPLDAVKEFSKTWRYRVNPSAGIFTRHGDLVAFVICNVGGWKFKSTKIEYLVVHPLYQASGLGTRLLHHVIQSEKKDKRSICLVPLYTKHIWYWYQRHGFYPTTYKAADGGGVYVLMNYHHYPTRSRSQF